MILTEVLSAVLQQAIKPPGLQVRNRERWWRPTHARYYTSHSGGAVLLMASSVNDSKDVAMVRATITISRAMLTQEESWVQWTNLAF